MFENVRNYKNIKGIIYLKGLKIKRNISIERVIFSSYLKINDSVMNQSSFHAVFMSCTKWSSLSIEADTAE